jgi:hypothetical protein
MEPGITPYMGTRDSALRKNNPLYGPDRFTYLPEDAESVAGMRAHRVMDRQLLDDLFRERRIEPASYADCHQFLLLALVVCFEFRALKLEFGLFGVCL